MKGILRGYEPVDYVSIKTGKPVKGGQIYFDYKSSKVFGYAHKDEYIPESSPLFKRVIEPLLEKLYDESSDIYGGTIEIDYEVTKRGNATFANLIELVITPRSAEAEKPVKKAG